MGRVGGGGDDGDVGEGSLDKSWYAESSILKHCSLNNQCMARSKPRVKN